MRWTHAEVMLRGLFLGLWAFAAFFQYSGTGVADGVGMTAIVSVSLALSAVSAIVLLGGRPGPRLGQWLFALCEKPGYAYFGILSGTLAAIGFVTKLRIEPSVLAACAAGGALSGLIVMALRRLPRGWPQTYVPLAATAIAVGAAVTAFKLWPDAIADVRIRFGGWLMLVGTPYYWLLSLVSEADESEPDVAVWCGMLSLACWLIPLTPNAPWLGAVLPAAIYYFYVRQVMRRLQAYKHTLRGAAYAVAGRHRQALVALRQATAVQPANRRARATLWDVHRTLEPNEILSDPELQRLIDPALCLDRAARLLADPPTSAQAAEAAHLLTLVQRLALPLHSAVGYWRAVAAVHAREWDRAEDEFARLLEPKSDAVRRSLLPAAWQLALSAHGDLIHRVGEPQLTLPGRRLEAIDVVEQALEESPGDEASQGLKRILYAGLGERDLGPAQPGRLDVLYVEQLGLALADDASQFRRAAEYFAIAARAWPAESPRLWQAAADVYERHGDIGAAHRAREQGKQSGLAAGAARLSPEAKQAFYRTVKRLGEDASARGDLDAAIDNYLLYGESERSGIETLRTLADLYERRGDALAALHAVERALIYNPQDGDLLARKDKYHYSITPEQARNAPEGLRQAIDGDYCVAKARQLLDLRDADVELLDWAKHLTDVAIALDPGGYQCRVLWSRVRLRLGQRDEALRVLEDVRGTRPARFISSDYEAAWYAATKILGDLYLNEFDRPDLAAAAFADYRQCSRSGADTLYKLGLAHERTGDAARAAKFFELVSTYEGHPLHYEATEALRRVRG